MPKKKEKNNSLLKKISLKIKANYEKYYYISPLDFADTSESNRLFVMFWSRLCLFLCLLYLILDLILYMDNYKEHIYNLIYLGIGVLDLFISFLLSLRFKDVSREKAYILKNIPIYTIFSYGIGIQAFLFYRNNDPYVNVIGFMFAATIVLCVFTISLPFFIIILCGFFAMIPGFYNSFGPIGIVNFLVLIIVFIFLAFFNRYKMKKYLDLLKSQKIKLEARTFGNFTLIYNAKVINFSRKKSEELIGYLIYKKGTSVKTKELISVLWGERADSARYGNNFRNLIVDIKHTFKDLEIQNFFISEYNNFRINPEIIKCDYYDFLAGDSYARKSYAGEFMNQYSWAEDINSFLERKSSGKR